MDYRIVDPATISAGPGPHPAASPFDKRISEALSVRAFEVYRVELPPGESTVLHDHAADRVEGQYVAVNLEAARQVQADAGGLVFTAVCAPVPALRPGGVE